MLRSIQGTGPMQRVRPIALHCQISRGAFSDELVFEVVQAGASEPHIGAASRQYCWHEDEKPLGPDEPVEGATISGLVAGRLLRHKNGQALVAIPDGEVITVEPSQIVKRPPEPKPDVPLESRPAVGD